MVCYAAKDNEHKERIHVNERFQFLSQKLHLYANHEDWEALV